MPRVDHRPTNESGFTLLEILVMLAIAAIAFSFVTLSVGNNGDDKRLQTEAEKVTALMQLALDESVLMSKPIGLRFEQLLESGSPQFRYEWSVYEQGTWQLMEEHSVFTPTTLAYGVELDFIAEGLATKLGVSPNSKLNSKSSSLNSSVGEALKYQPDIFFLHSGEISPDFELLLSNERLETRYRVEGNLLGQLRLQTENDGFDGAGISGSGRKDNDGDWL